MKTKLLIPIISIIALSAILYFLAVQNDCTTIEKREARISEFEGKNKEIAIMTELVLDGEIISGYEIEGTGYFGIAVFAPDGDNKFKFQTAMSRSSSRASLHRSIAINQQSYSLFYSNREDLVSLSVEFVETNEIHTFDLTSPQIIAIPHHTNTNSIRYFYTNINGDIVA